MMNIVTLTTDYGWKDFYVGMVKGAILAKTGPVIFADISHDIEKYNIIQASYVLKNSFPSFPKGTIHLLSVNTDYNANPNFLLVIHNGHYFIGPDNGIFSLVFDDLPKDIYILKGIQGNHKFIERKIFAQTIQHIKAGMSLDLIGTKVEQIVQRISLQPIITKDQIRGTIIHIDSYSNVILNIDKDLFNRVGQGRSFELFFKRYDPITTIADSYADVSLGEPLCLFNVAGFLELAVNKGKAAELYSLDIDEAIQINFLD